MRIADLVAQFIIDNVSTEYKYATMWSDDLYPFNNPDNKVILVRQSGRPVDAMIREHDIEITMISKANSEGAELTALYDDAESALSYIKNNFIVNDDLKFTITQDVTGPNQVGTNRFYYRFAVKTYSE